MRPQPAGPEDTGRKGYLEANEPSDGIRRRIAYAPFWYDLSEERIYEDAVAENPIGRDEGSGTYITRIASIVAGKYVKANLEMPRARMTHREHAARLRQLEAQRTPEWNANEWKGQ